MRLRNKKLLLSYLLLLVVLPIIASVLQGWIGTRMINRQLSCAGKSVNECFEWVKKLSSLEAELRSKGITPGPHMTPAEMGRLADVYTEYGIDLSGARTMALAIRIIEAITIGALAALLLRKKYHVNVVAGASLMLAVFGLADIRLLPLAALKAGLICVTGLCILWYKELPD